MSWWDGNIDKAKEGKNGEKPTEGKDGNRSYGNGTYGQSDYTVRERNDGSGLSDVYIKSDSGKGHSHDVIDRNGNIVDRYHDFLLNELSNFSNEELTQIINLTTNQLVLEVASSLKQKSLTL